MIKIILLVIVLVIFTIVLIQNYSETFVFKFLFMEFNVPTIFGIAIAIICGVVITTPILIGVRRFYKRKYKELKEETKQDNKKNRNKSTP